MALPTFDPNTIAVYLQTQWGGSSEGSFRVWTDPATITVFIAQNLFVDGSNGEGDGLLSMSLDQVSRAREAFSIWQELSGVKFVELTGPEGADITFAYSTATKNDGTYTTATLGADIGTIPNVAVFEIDRQQIWMDGNANTWPSLQPGQITYNSKGFQTYLHEIGHALGLSHPGSYDASDNPPPTFLASAEFAQDNMQNSVMSYFGAYRPGTGWVGDGATTADLFPATPMVYDILAIQQKYGANMSTRAGDTTYGFNSNAGWAFFDFTATPQAIFTIWDAGGIDTIDASGFTQFQRITLVDGQYSDIGGLTDNIAIAFGATIENAKGGTGVDNMTGNAADNRLEGNTGSDELHGGGGNDSLFGGDQDDRLFGDTGGDQLEGGNGDDVLDGGGNTGGPAP